MHFLEPTALWVLLAGLLMIAVYLLRMPRRRQILPSSLIISMMRQFARRERRKLRTILSFAILVLAFLLTSFDAGRPYKSPDDAGKHDHILLLDISASMKGALKIEEGEEGTKVLRTRFDKARERAEKLIESMPISDRMMIMTVGSMAQIVRNFEADIKLVEQSLERVEPQETGTNWEDAGRLLREVLPAAEAPVCHLLTDGTGLEAAEWADLGAEVEWRYYNVFSTEEPAEVPRNVAITNFRARTTFHSDRDFQIIAQVRNYDKAPVEVNLDLYLDDVLMDTTPLKLGEEEVRTEVLAQTLHVGGVLIGRLAVPGPEEKLYPDQLELDNVAYDVVPSPRRPKVLVYSEEKAGFLISALSANSNALAYRQHPDNYSPDYAADIFVFYDLADVPDELPPKDIIIVNTKGKLMSIEVQREFENPMMRTWNRHHPLMNYLSLSNLLIAKAQGFTVPGWADTLAETASGPLIIAGETPERQLAFIGLDPRESDLPFRVAMPMLVANAILWMKERAPDPDPIRPGETYHLQLGVGDLKELEITYPDDTKRKHEVQPDGTVAVLDTHQVGIYRFQAGEETGAFTVNLNDPVESSLTSGDELKIGDETVKLADEKKATDVWRLWPALAVLALGILLVENSLYHRRILF